MDSKEQIREQKLEAAIAQLIELVAAMRFRQRRWKEEYGSHNLASAADAERRVDNVLQNMGVDETTDFKRVNIKFVKELTVEEVGYLSEKLIK